MKYLAIWATLALATACQAWADLDGYTWYSDSDSSSDSTTQSDPDANGSDSMGSDSDSPTNQGPFGTDTHTGTIFYTDSASPGNSTDSGSGNADSSTSTIDSAIDIGGDTESNSDTNPDYPPDTNSAIDTDTNSDSVTDNDVDSEIDTSTGTDTFADSDTLVDTNSEVDTMLSFDTNDDSETDEETATDTSSDFDICNEELCPDESPFCNGEGDCVQCITASDCEVLNICRENECVYSVHTHGYEESLYEDERHHETTTTYFLSLPPLEHDARLVSFHLEISSFDAPYFAGFFALYDSHPVDDMPFGDAIVFGDTFNRQSLEVAEPPLADIILEAGKIYWIAVDIGEDSSGRTSDIGTTGTSWDESSIVPRYYMRISNTEINLQDGPTEVGLTTLLEFDSTSSTNMLPSYHLTVEDVE